MDRRHFQPDTYIVRFNEAVIDGYEEYVGNWTSLHVFNESYQKGGHRQSPYSSCRRHTDIAMLAHTLKKKRRRVTRRLTSAFRVSFGPCYVADWYNEVDGLLQEYNYHCKQLLGTGIYGNQTADHRAFCSTPGSGAMTMLQLLKYRCETIEMSGWLRPSQMGHYYDAVQMISIHKFSLEREVIMHIARMFPHRLIIT